MTSSPVHTTPALIRPTIGAFGNARHVGGAGAAVVGGELEGVVGGAVVAGDGLGLEHAAARITRVVSQTRARPGHMSQPRLSPS